MLIDLIGEHGHLGVTRQHFDKPLKLLAGIYASRGVGGGAEKHHARALR